MLWDWIIRLEEKFNELMTRKALPVQTPTTFTSWEQDHAESLRKRRADVIRIKEKRNV